MENTLLLQPWGTAEIRVIGFQENRRRGGTYKCNGQRGRPSKKPKKN